MEKTTRIDRYLWAVRLFKSRSAATEAVRKGRVLLDGKPVKPSHNIAAGSTIIVRKPPVTYTFLVKNIIDNRVGAKLVPEALQDLTADEEKNKIKSSGDTFFGYRPRGRGRPTKRERREIEEFWDDR